MLRLLTKILMLPLLLLPLSFSEDIQIIMYQKDSCLTTHFEAVLMEISKVGCSAVCLQMKSSCVGFCYNKTSGDCQVFSLAEDSTLDLLQEPGVNLYFDKSKEGILQDKSQFIKSDTAVTFSDAKTLCSSHGGSIYVPQNLLDISLAIPFIVLPYLWVGLTDAQKEGTFRDVNTGNLATYLPWFPLEPNGFTVENCVGMNALGFFFDIKCSTLLHALCVKEFSWNLL